MSSRPQAIVIGPSPIVQPFEGDCLERKAIAARLSRLIARLGEGGVIGVDGRWGEGKTWVAKHWIASLGARQPTVYLDAFQCDFEDNPFAAVARALLEAIGKAEPDDRLRGQLRDGLLKVGAAVALATIKVAAAAATAGVSAAAIDALVQNGNEVARTGIDSIEAAVKSQLDAAEEQRRSLAGLRKAISIFTDKQEVPLVVAIDELDRCRPTYALKLLDVLKHLFDMPGIVFVLFVNREQLEAMVSAQFGKAIGAAYLDKFVHLWVPLASPSAGEPKHEVRRDRALLAQFLRRTSLQLEGEANDLLSTVAAVLYAFAAPARAVERAATLIAGVARIDALVDNQLAPWLVGLKVAHADVFRGLVVDDLESHRRAAELAQSAAHRLNWLKYSEFLTQMASVHRSLLAPDRSWGREPASKVTVGVYDSAAEALRDIGRCIKAIED